MWKKVFFALAAALAVFAAVVATRPASYRVSRNAAIAAPPAVVFAQVADFHRWDSWSPWAKLDPSMQTTYGGTLGTVGATQAWKGNDKVGEGRMTIVEARPPERLGIRLEFIKPFASTNSTEFTFAPESRGTRVTWTMAGNNNFIGKAFGLFMDFDTAIGKDFDKGLAAMRGVAEAEAKKAAAVH